MNLTWLINQASLTLNSLKISLSMMLHIMIHQLITFKDIVDYES